MLYIDYVFFKCISYKTSDKDETLQTTVQNLFSMPYMFPETIFVLLNSLKHHSITIWKIKLVNLWIVIFQVVFKISFLVDNPVESIYVHVYIIHCVQFKNNVHCTELKTLELWISRLMLKLLVLLNPRVG